MFLIFRLGFSLINIFQYFPFSSDTASSGDSSDSDGSSHRDSSVYRVLRKLEKRVSEQDKVIGQQRKWFQEQCLQHSVIQDKVASLEVQSQQIAGKTLDSFRITK